MTMKMMMMMMMMMMMFTMGMTMITTIIFLGEIDAAGRISWTTFRGFIVEMAVVWNEVIRKVRLK